MTSMLWNPAAPPVQGCEGGEGEEGMERGGSWDPHREIWANLWLAQTFSNGWWSGRGSPVSWNSFQVKVLEFPQPHPVQKPEALG